MSFLIEKMELENLSAVKDLLKKANLPSEDIEEHWETFLIAKDNNEMIGAVGLEIWKDKALLRSLVVRADFRSLGIGKELYNKCIELCVKKNIIEVGLLTTTAEGFFNKLGFVKVWKEEIPTFIKQTKEFQVYCPCSSTVMIKQLHNSK